MSNILKRTLQEMTGMTNDDYSIVTPYFKPYTPKKNQILLSVGQHNERLYFIEQGCLRIFYIDKRGNDITRFLSFEKHFATALVSFITNNPSYEFIQALENTKLYYINRKDLLHLRQKVPAMELFYQEFVKESYVDDVTWSVSAITMSDEEKYLYLLKQCPRLVPLLSNQVVGSLTNISHKVLNKFKVKNNDK